MRRGPSLSLLFSLSLAALAIGPGSPVAMAQGNERAEARGRFERAVELFDEERFEAALAEFQRAYDIAPSPTVLFNLAQVHAALGHAIEAAEIYERYLRESGAAISAERRRIIEEEIERQRARIAFLTIETSAPSAIIAIDDVEIGTAPFAGEVRVSAGEHVISARADGYTPVRRRLRIAGGMHEALRLQLFPDGSARGTLRITSPLPAVEVVIDDVSVGLTPFDATVPVTPGTHQLRASRPGYDPYSRTLEVSAGAELSAPIDLTPDPTAAPDVMGMIEVEIPEAVCTARIDGREVRSSTRIPAPIGPHLLVIEAPDREPWTGPVEVLASGVGRVRPELAWTARAIADQNGRIDAHLISGITLVAAGLAFVGVGTGLFIWNRSEWSILVSEYERVDMMCHLDRNQMECNESTGAGIIPSPFRNLDEYEVWVNRERQTRTGIDVAAVVALGLGGALTLAGTLVLIATPGRPPERGQARSSLTRARIGPGTISVETTF